MLIYDLETFPNYFQCSAVSIDRDDLHTWEISDRRNDWESLYAWLSYLAQNQVEMIGYNNLGFDYPIIHAMLTGKVPPTAEGAYTMCQSIIGARDRWAHQIWQSERLIPQIDLFKIHHFDNAARSTGLKALQIAMRSQSVEDMPVTVGTWLDDEQKDIVKSYGEHDVTETKAFALHSLDMIDFRRELLRDGLSGDVLNFADKKIGTQILIDALGRDACYTRIDGRREPRQTRRESIALGELILPNVAFDHPEFQRVHDWFRSQTISETKGVFEGLCATVDGFSYHYGTGGIHGSVERKIYRSTPDAVIIDVDVASLYPSVAIVNKFAPAHLGELFSQEYEGLKVKRFEHAKGTAKNAALKLGLVGAYGDSNNEYSPFFDPAFTMSITINGQLQLSMLAERLMAISGVEIIQINTDGITARVPRNKTLAFSAACADWEELTGLDLESARYDAMFVRDVNSYIAVTDTGKVKRIGAYAHERAAQNPATREIAWHKDHSALAVPKAAEACLVHGVAVSDAIWCNDDPFDFMASPRIRGGQLMLGGRRVSKKTRYYLATDGEPLVIRRPPPEGKHAGDFKKKAGVTDAQYAALNVTGQWDERIHTGNKSVYADRDTAVHKGWLVAECNRADAFDWSRLARDYYIERAADLCDLTEV